MSFLKPTLFSYSSSKNWVFFPEALLFRIMYFSSDLFISNVCVLFVFLSSDTIQELYFPILNLEITFCLKQVYLKKTCDLKSSFRPYSVWKNIMYSIYWKMKFLKQVTYEIYALGKLLKFGQISIFLWICFCRGFFENLKGPGIQVPGHIFYIVFSFLFLILQKSTFPDCLLTTSFSKMQFAFHF